MNIYKSGESPVSAFHGGFNQWMHRATEPCSRVSSPNSHLHRHGPKGIHPALFAELLIHHKPIKVRAHGDRFGQRGPYLLRVWQKIHTQART